MNSSTDTTSQQVPAAAPPQPPKPPQQAQPPSQVPQQAPQPPRPIPPSDILITFALPCYNAAAYMDRCIESILAGAKNHLNRVEIIIVDDGSTQDDTAAKADSWQMRFPDVIRAVHQENGGHGAAVNAGLARARGAYFKVVDADDWLDEEALALSLVRLKWLATSNLDLFITNYVYEKLDEGTHTPIRLGGPLPEGRIFGWSEVGTFKPQQNLLMHAVIYRTELLRDVGLELPKHTFYVDNIFVYVPLPAVKSIFYLNADLYRYYIGREGQSINEATMVKRIDQQLLITRIMIDAYHLREDIENPRLRTYMIHYLTMMMAISSVFLRLTEREDAEDARRDLWAYLKEKDPVVYPKIRGGLLGLASNLPGPAGRATTLAGYRLARKLFKFN
ncbi:MAG: glycosyltransferase family 2 protein [Coriobacteriales bacterium]|jgi:glycosyltransferase involved in cell wall biosynthesis|nr:glycosyltransferase family 2 protein [Coriobacteriales bacterium]